MHRLSYLSLEVDPMDLKRSLEDLASAESEGKQTISVNRFLATSTHIWYTSPWLLRTPVPMRARCTLCAHFCRCFLEDLHASTYLAEACSCGLRCKPMTQSEEGGWERWARLGDILKFSMGLFGDGAALTFSSSKVRFGSGFLQWYRWSEAASFLE